MQISIFWCDITRHCKNIIGDAAKTFKPTKDEQLEAIVRRLRNCMEQQLSKQICLRSSEDYKPDEMCSFGCGFVAWMCFVFFMHVCALAQRAVRTAHGWCQLQNLVGCQGRNDYITLFTVKPVMQRCHAPFQPDCAVRRTVVVAIEQRGVWSGMWSRALVRTVHIRRCSQWHVDQVFSLLTSFRRYQCWNHRRATSKSASSMQPVCNNTERVTQRHPAATSLPLIDYSFSLSFSLPWHVHEKDRLIERSTSVSQKE